MQRFDESKRRWRESLVSTPEQLMQGDENVCARIKGCGDHAKRMWELFKKYRAEGSPSLFRPDAYEKSNDMTREYNCIKAMAIGYATYGTECYQDPELLSDILFALEYMYTHFNGEAELNGTGWRSIRIFNWWDWQIGSPMAYMDTMVLVDGHLTVEQKRNYLKVFNHLVAAPRDYGANKVHYGILMAKSGLLCEREELIKIGIEGIENTYLYADGGVNDKQGFYRDGSYVFHTLHPMNFTYGMGHFTAVIELAELLCGSELALSDEKMELVYSWLYKSFLPFYRDGIIGRGVLGRHPLSSKGSGYGLLKAIINLYSASSEERKGEMAALLRMLIAEHPQFENGRCDEFFASLNLSQYLKYIEAYAREGETKWVRSGMYAFNSMDRAIQHTDDYAFLLSVSSSRIYNYECINNENMDGWYLGDGMLCLENDPLQYDAEYWKNVNKYRLPGTTVNNKERPLVTIAQKNEYLSSRDFVGTLSAGKTGVSVMQLESFHFDGNLETQRTKQLTPYGGPLPTHECTLTANKAYFFLDGYAVCLGSAINASDGVPVYTVLDNRKGKAIIEKGRVTGYAESKVTVNGEAVNVPKEDTVYDSVRCVTVDSTAICPLTPTALTLRATDGTPSFTEVLWQHGVDPVNGTYAYMIVPDAGKAEKLVSSAPVTVICNDDCAQVIKENATGDRYFVFHKAAKADGVEVDRPLLVCVKQDGIYVCDATQKAQNAEVKVDGKIYNVTFSDNTTVKLN